MSWAVEYTNEFGAWWAVLTDGEQEDVTAVVELLMEHGPSLPFPYSFGGRKTGNDRFYKRYLPLVDRLYDEHLEELRHEGRIE